MSKSAYLVESSNAKLIQKGRSFLEELCIGRDDNNKDMTIAAPSLAMVYSPKQVWGETYDVDVALERGTLFPELDKPFLGYLKEDIRGR